MEILEFVLDIKESLIVFFVSMVEFDLDNGGRFLLEFFNSILDSLDFFLRFFLLLLFSLDELVNFDSEEDVNKLFCWVVDLTDFVLVAFGIKEFFDFTLMNDERLEIVFFSISFLDLLVDWIKEEDKLGFFNESLFFLFWLLEFLLSSSDVNRVVDLIGNSEW